MYFFGNASNDILTSTNLFNFRQLYYDIQPINIDTEKCDYSKIIIRDSNNSDNNDNEIKINIISRRCSIRNLTISNNTTLQNLTKIVKKNHRKLESMRLSAVENLITFKFIYQGIKLDPNRELKYYNIRNNDTLYFAIQNKNRKGFQM